MNGQSTPRIEMTAARLAIEWKNLFAAELQRAALELAQDSELVTAEHFREAVPAAVSKVLRDAQVIESTNAQ